LGILRGKKNATSSYSSYPLLVYASSSFAKVKVKLFPASARGAEASERYTQDARDGAAGEEKRRGVVVVAVVVVVDQYEGAKCDPVAERETSGVNNAFPLQPTLTLSQALGPNFAACSAE